MRRNHATVVWSDAILDEIAAGHERIRLEYEQTFAPPPAPVPKQLNLFVQEVRP